MSKRKGWIHILNILSMIAIGAHFIHIILVWQDIPNQIAIHFTNGEADNWGSKYFLLIMPAIALVTWWLFGKLTKNPEKLNYINLTDKNREKQYKMVGYIIGIMQNSILFMFTFANESFLRSAAGLEDDLFFILSIVTLVLIPFVTFYYLIWAVRLKN